MYVQATLPDLVTNVLQQYIFQVLEAPPYFIIPLADQYVFFNETIYYSFPAT